MSFTLQKKSPKTISRKRGGSVKRSSGRVTWIKCWAKTSIDVFVAEFVASGCFGAGPEKGTDPRGPERRQRLDSEKVGRTHQGRWLVISTKNSKTFDMIRLNFFGKIQPIHDFWGFFCQDWSKQEYLHLSICVCFASMNPFVLSVLFGAFYNTTPPWGCTFPNVHSIRKTSRKKER